MTAEEFRERAMLDQTVADYLDDVAQEAIPGQNDRGGALALLFGIVAYALYRLAKNYFDHQRGLDETELRQEMLTQVDRLIQQGWGRDKALAAVLKVSKDVASLRPDNPALTAAMTLLGAGRPKTGA